MSAAGNVVTGRFGDLEERRQLAAILAGLRLLQIVPFPPDERGTMIHDIFTGDREFLPLSPKEIDTLCERLNCGVRPILDLIAAFARASKCEDGGVWELLYGIWKAAGGTAEAWNEMIEGGDNS